MFIASRGDPRATCASMSVATGDGPPDRVIGPPEGVLALGRDGAAFCFRREGAPAGVGGDGERCGELKLDGDNG